MRDKKIKALTLAALFAALTTVATLLIQIPTPTKGYVNLGDCIVNVAAWLLGPIYGTAAAGIGSALADIISGYVIYAPATLIIKGAMAVVSYFIFSSLVKRFSSLPARACAAAVAELVMALGYSLYEAVLYHSFASAIIGIPANLVQGIIGAVTSVLIYELVISRLPKII